MLKNITKLNSMFDLKEKKQKLVEEYNQNAQTLQSLSLRQQQIIGQIQLIEEIERETKETKEKEKSQSEIIKEE